VWYSTDKGANWNNATGNGIPQNTSWTSVAVSGDNMIAADVGAGIGAVWYSNQQPPCFLSSSRVLTSDGEYKRVGMLSSNDYLISAFTNKPVKVKRCGYTVVNFSSLEKTNVLYKIPASHFSNDVPINDTYLSGHHRIVVIASEDDFTGVQAYKILEEKCKLSEKEVFEVISEPEIRYYHIEVDGGQNAIYLDGIAVETLAEGDWEKHNFILN